MSTHIQAALDAEVEHRTERVYDLYQQATTGQLQDVVAALGGLDLHIDADFPIRSVKSAINNGALMRAIAARVFPGNWTFDVLETLGGGPPSVNVVEIHHSLKGETA